MDLQALWTKIAFLLVHIANFELPLVFFSTALAAWYLSHVLNKHNARQRDAKVARRVAQLYALTPLLLWILSRVLG